MARLRSPRYPGIALAEAISRAGRLFQNRGTATASYETAALETGYTGLGGPFRTGLTALKTFGLIDEAGRETVRVSSPEARAPRRRW